MGFTGVEAIAKLGRQVRICDSSRSNDGVKVGTPGEVSKAQRLPGATNGPRSAGWVVEVQFNDHLEPQVFTKREYESSLEEI
jgi:hypothetical protein